MTQNTSAQFQTGAASSRPAYKKRIRASAAQLRAAQTAYALAQINAAQSAPTYAAQTGGGGSGTSGDDNDKFMLAWDALGVAQHHDSVPGTMSTAQSVNCPDEMPATDSLRRCGRCNNTGCRVLEDYNMRLDGADAATTALLERSLRLLAGLAESGGGKHGSGGGRGGRSGGGGGGGGGSGGTTGTAHAAVTLVKDAAALARSSSSSSSSPSSSSSSPTTDGILLFNPLPHSRTELVYAKFSAGGGVGVGNVGDVGNVGAGGGTTNGPKSNGSNSNKWISIPSVLDLRDPVKPVSVAAQLAVNDRVMTQVQHTLYSIPFTAHPLQHTL
jgi:hypothetical protein